MLSRALLSLTTILGFISCVLAANATAISSGGCVSPSTFATCLQSANTQAATCVDEAGGNDLYVIACEMQQEANQLLCYMSDCWNKVYSCEYQYLASKYLIARNNEDTVPFYPAPANAPGGCSCNMGNVVKNTTASIALIQNKCSSYSYGDYTSLSECHCCAWSAALSSFYGICPTTDPSQLGLDVLENEVKSTLSITGSCSSLNADTCLGKFGIGSADNGTYVDPANLPAGGSDPLSTTTGVGYPLSSPPGGQTMTVALLSATHTVTAAAYNAKNVQLGSTTDSSASSSSSASGKSAGDGNSNLAVASFSRPLLEVSVACLIVASVMWL